MDFLVRILVPDAAPVHFPVEAFVKYDGVYSSLRAAGLHPTLHQRLLFLFFEARVEFESELLDGEVIFEWEFGEHFSAGEVARLAILHQQRRDAGFETNDRFRRAGILGKDNLRV